MDSSIESLYPLLPGLSRLGGVALEGKAAVTAAFSRALAGAMLYPGGEGEPFEKGRESGLILRGIHPDVLEIGGGNSGSISVEDIRSLQKEAYLKPNQAPGRVFILLGAAAMTPQAQNAMLKTLEEPPGAVRFIFTVENRHNLLPTVQSRLVTVPLEAQAGKFSGSFPESVRKTALLVEDWERTVELLGEKTAVRLFEDCEQAFSAICDASAYRLMTIFASYEKKREEFVLFCLSLRSVCGRRLIEMGADAPRLARATVILAEVSEQAGQNVFLPLLGSFAAARLALADDRR